MIVCYNVYIVNKESEPMVNKKFQTKAQNKAGTWFALVALDNGNFLVYKQCTNYNGNVYGGISKTWRCCQTHQRMNNTDFQAMARNGLPEDEARALFNKKLKGKAK